MRVNQGSQPRPSSLWKRSRPSWFQSECVWTSIQVGANEHRNDRHAIARGAELCPASGTRGAQIFEFRKLYDRLETRGVVQGWGAHQVAWEGLPDASGVAGSSGRGGQPGRFATTAMARGDAR